jgi:hypothetical protein
MLVGSASIVMHFSSQRNILPTTLAYEYWKDLELAFT